MALANPFLRGTYAAQAANQSTEQAELQGLATLLKLKQMQEEQPFRMDALRGATADRESMARYRDAQIQDMQRKSAQAAQQQAAMGGLSQLLARPFQGVEGQGAPPPTGVMMNEEAALRAAIEADQRGEQVRMDVPNPGMVQGLAVAADPQRAIPEILKQQRGPAPMTPYQQEILRLQQERLTMEGNKPGPQQSPMPLTIRDPNDPSKSIVIDAKTREKIGDAPPPRPTGREDNESIRRMMQFGSAVEKSGVAQQYATLKNAVDLIADEGVLSYLTGPGGVVPNRLLSDKITNARQALQRVLNIELKNRSGAAVTVPEWERFKKEAGVGILSKPSQIPEYLRQAKLILDKHYESVAAGFPEDARNRYFQEMGRVSPFGQQSAPAAPAAADDDLINKYLKR